jgi:hypothetical protein
MAKRDTWDLDDTGLTPETPLSVLMEYLPYTTSEDKKGHDIFLGARFPKDIAHWLAEIKEDSAKVYKTNSDIVRDAVHLGLLIISLRAKNVERWKTLSALMQARAALFEEARIFRECEEVADDVATLVDHNDSDAAIEHLRRFKDGLRSYSPKYGKALRQALASRRVQGLLEKVD